MAIADNDGLTDDLFRKIAAYVYEHARIKLGDAKRELVKARLGKLIREKNFSGFREFYRYMIEDKTGDALQEVMNAISTNLTSFFRESKHFDFLGGQLIPNLVQLAQKTGQRTLRGWSAGSSSGEEVYTIAIVLREAIAQQAGWDVKLLASDIDTNMLQRGAAGVYPEKRFASVPKHILQRYFISTSQRSDDGSEKRYQAKDALREMIRFRKLNLMAAWPFQRKFDFIFCRNVMIYFDRQTQERLVNRFCDNLVPGGHLFIGHSEGLSGVKHPLQYVQPTIYQKPN